MTDACACNHVCSAGMWAYQVQIDREMAVVEPKRCDAHRRWHPPSCAAEGCVRTLVPCVVARRLHLPCPADCPCSLWSLRWLQVLGSPLLCCKQAAHLLGLSASGRNRNMAEWGTRDRRTAGCGVRVRAAVLQLQHDSLIASFSDVFINRTLHVQTTRIYKKKISASSCKQRFLLAEPTRSGPSKRAGSVLGGPAHHCGGHHAFMRVSLHPSVPCPSLPHLHGHMLTLRLHVPIRIVSSAKALAKNQRPILTSMVTK